MKRERRFMPVAPPFLRTFKAFDDWLNMSRFWSSATAVDAYETDTEFVVKMDVPGWRKEDLKVRVEESAVYITGDREETKEVEEKDYYRHERHTEKIHEVIPIPIPVDPDGTRAKMVNGVLEVVVPKTDQEDRGIRIDIT